LLSHETDRLRITNDDASPAAAINNDFAPVVGKTYLLKYTLLTDSGAGGARILFGGHDTGAGGSISPGSYVVLFTATGTGALSLSNGGTNAAGQYTEWTDISVQEVPGVHFMQNTAASRPTLGASATARWLESDGGDSMVANGGDGDASSFNFLHDGTGGEMFFAWRPSGATLGDNAFVYFANSGFASANVGVAFSIDNRSSQPSDNNLRLYMSRGVSSQPAISLNTNGTLIDETSDRVWDFRYQEGADPEAAWTDFGIEQYSRDTDYAPSTANATNPAELFVNNGGTYSAPSGARFYGAAFFDRVLDAEERADLSAHFDGKLASPPVPKWRVSRSYAAIFVKPV